MRTYHKPKNGVTLEQRIFRCMKKSPAPMRCGDVAELIHVRYESVVSTVQRMRTKGIVERVQGSRTYRLLTDVEPVDERGQSPAAQAALRSTWIRLRTLSQPPKPAIPTLAQLLGVYQLDTDASSCVNPSREGAPEANAA